MIKYLDSALQEFPDDLYTNAATPEDDHLFKVHDDSETQYLTEDQEQDFCHTLSHMVFMRDRE